MFIACTIKYRLCDATDPLPVHSSDNPLGEARKFRFPRPSLSAGQVVGHKLMVCISYSSIRYDDQIKTHVQNDKYYTTQCNEMQLSQEVRTIYCAIE
jgi:hypothetical protein